MTDESINDIAEFDLAFGRRAMLREVKFESGLRLIRLVLLEGRRITQVDIDETCARELGIALVAASRDDNDDASVSVQ